ncbi:MAG: hypothetical protein KBS86_02090 [Proteobacteria bacterium]|nr:hypothetical protein [Candidatus Enterousia scatequi]
MLLYILVGISLLLFGLLIALFFISRKSQRVMDSLLTIMTDPERAQIKHATEVLNIILADEINKLQSAFEHIQETLRAQIKSAEELRESLTTQNDNLVAIANNATTKMATMSQNLDNTVGELQNIIESNGWQTVEFATDKFANTINELLSKIDTTNITTTEKITVINDQIDRWIANSDELNKRLSTGFESNVAQIKDLSDNTTAFQNKLSELSVSVVDGFDKVKTGATEYQTIMEKHDALLTSHLTKLDEYSKQSKKQLTGQANALTTTANIVGGQVRLAEASIEKQIHKLTDAIENMTTSATTTEASVRSISNELANLTNRFNGEIKEFASGVVSELKTVSGVANVTLDNTKSAATKFSDSVKAMATGVRETLIEMNTAHTQLSAQSENLIKMSSQTTAQLQPLSELIDKYYTALPDLANSSIEINDNLAKIVANLNSKITDMKSTVTESTNTINESAIKLDDLAGQSRQQMIDLMSDYAKAVNTMQTLNKQMVVARATAPMDAISNAPANPIAAVSGTDFIKSIRTSIDKLNEQAVDLTRALGSEIPDIVWQKYHNGDMAIFAKWLAKMLKATESKQIRDMLKNDTVFKSQATQFVRAFDKILTAGAQTDSPKQVEAKLLKTDLGTIYLHLKGK